MKKALITAAVVGIITAPAFAQQPSTVDRVLRELEALTKRVEKLEEDNSGLKAENTQLQEKNDRLEATTEYLRANASATRKELAEETPKIGDIEKIAKAAEWASRISWKGDLRYRHENVDPEEATTDQTRERIRARFGLTGKVNDTVTATVQVATNGSNNDPRSTNQTLGEDWTRKGVGIDLAYADWKPVEGFNLQFGKMPQPWQRVGSYFWDGDITPEGIAAKGTRGPFFASAFGYYLSERSTAADATLLGAQLGMSGTVGAAKLTGAVGYFDVGAVQGEQTAQPTGCASGFNNAFFGGAQGNTTTTVAGCPFLVDDFNMLEALLQADMTIWSRPLTFFVDYIQNQEADDLDNGMALGVTLGKASDPHSWEIGYVYQKTEKDAQFGQFVDSDFGGGVTDVEGSVLKIGYALAKGWVLNGTYFMNDRFVDAVGATEQDYDRYQLDLNFKY